MRATGTPAHVPLRFLIVGVAVFACAWTVLAVRPELVAAHPLHPGVLTVVHAVTVGFGASVLLGAVHPLVPVLLGVPLARPRWGGPAWAIFTTGTVALLAGFWISSYVLVAAGGTISTLGATVVAMNLVRTARRVPRIPWPALCVLASVAALVLTLLLGLALATARLVPAIAPFALSLTPLHLTAGLAGAFGLAMLGAGHQLLGMFLLAHGRGHGTLRVGAISASVAALFALATRFGPEPMRTPWLVERSPAELGLATALAFIVAAVLVDAVAAWRRRMRARPDAAVEGWLVALAWIPVAWLLFAAGRPSDAVIAFLVGAVGTGICGMALKIASFLTWQERYAATVGAGDASTVPTLGDMIRPRLARFTTWGLGLATAGVLVARSGLPGDANAALVAAIAAALGAAGAWSAVAHLAWIVVGRHRPRAAESATAAPAAGGAALRANGAT